MVKKLLKSLGLSLFFIFALVAFMPKESFYFLLEKELKEFELVISGESLKERLFSLEIEELSISAKEVDALEIESAEITLLGVYNAVKLQNIELSSLVSSYVPPSISAFELHYSIFNPLKIEANAIGDFGEARAEFTLLNRELKAYVTPSKQMQTKHKNTMRMLKKDENGEYVYAKTF